MTKKVDQFAQDSVGPDEGTIREHNGKICIFVDGYWIRYYAPPPNTMAEKRELIYSLRRRVFHHTEEGINSPGWRTEIARKYYDAETDSSKKRVKAAMLAGSLFNRATDIFTSVVDLEEKGIHVDDTNQLMRQCEACFMEALELGKQVRHFSGEEGVDELWGEPFKAFSMPVDKFFYSRYVKMAQTFKAIDCVVNRMMAVLDPVKVVITNYPEDKTEDLILINNPEDESAGKRVVPFSREIYIERADFREDPPSPKKFYRLGPERNVRLKGAYIIRGESFVKDENGVITEIHATYYKDSKSGEDNSGVKAKGVLHWVSVPHAKEIEVRNYDRLFTDETPTNHEGKDFLEFFNTESLKTITGYGEPALTKVKSGEQFQFMRIGYFCCDPDSSEDKIVFNKTVSLRDGFKKKK